MKKEDVINLITNILKLDHPVSENDSMDTVSNWDSLNHLKILTELDKRLSGKLADIEEIAHQDSVSGLLQVLTDHHMLQS